MAKRGDRSNVTIVIEPIQTQTMSVFVRGLTPIILNRMSEKARRELLLPTGRKNAAQKAANLKHNPVEEFRAAAYLLPSPAPTLLGVMASAFKGAMMTAAADLPGTNKAQIGRLVHVPGEYVPIFGIPKLFMSVTRSADANRTPDIRTRVIIPEWAAAFQVMFAVPLLNETAIANLLLAAGQTAGVGDWRPEKGKGTYGQFVLVPSDDPDFRRIVETGGREAQQAAMDRPEPYNEETAEMLEWFEAEVVRRGKKVAA